MYKLIRAKIQEIFDYGYHDINKADDEDLHLLFRWWLYQCEYEVAELICDIKEPNILQNYECKFNFNPSIVGLYHKYYTGISYEHAYGSFTSTVVEEIIDYPLPLHQKIKMDLYVSFIDKMQDILDGFVETYEESPDLELHAWQQKNILGVM